MLESGLMVPVHSTIYNRFRLLASLLACILVGSPDAQASFEPSDTPIGLSGVKTSIRTVWFSADGSKVHGDFDSLTTWEIASRRIISSVEIPGYKLHPSAVSTDGSVWVQGVGAYDTPERPDLYRTSPALVSRQPDGQLKLTRTGKKRLGVGAFISGNEAAAFVVSEKKHYSVLGYDLKTRQFTTTYVRPSTAKKRMPTKLVVSADGRLLAVGLGGRAQGVWLVDAESGKRLATFKTASEVTSMTFVGNVLFFSDLKGHIYRWTVGPKLSSKASLVVKSPGMIMAMDVHPTGSHVVIGGLRGVHLVDLKAKKVTRRLLRSRALTIRFSSDGEQVAIGIQKSLAVSTNPSVFVFRNMPSQ